MFSSLMMFFWFQPGTGLRFDDMLPKNVSSFFLSIVVVRDVSASSQKTGRIYNRDDGAASYSICSVKCRNDHVNVPTCKIRNERFPKQPL